MSRRSKPYYERDGIRLYHGDAADVLPTLEAESISAVVSDPPAGIAFMSKSWDRDKGGRDQWVAWLASILSECNRTMKPGAHAVIWALPRTSGWTHRAIEDAGLDVRDCVTHLFGSGFPKSHDISKAIDKQAGADRDVVGPAPYTRGRATQRYSETRRVSYDYDPQPITAPATPEAERWQGWGTALKPGAEFWYLARKPLFGTVAATVLQHGTGGLNIAACRIDGGPVTINTFDDGAKPFGGGAGHPYTSRESQGRWPPNVLLDDTAAALLDQMSGERKGRVGMTQHGSGTNGVYGTYKRSEQSFVNDGVADSGGASRFFPVLPIDDPDTLRFLYCAKSSRRERNAGLDGLPERALRDGGSEFGKMTMWNGENGDDAWRKKNPNRPAANHHPTVKPLALMRWLLTLVTPPGGTVLDPFAGSGTTGVAAAQLGVPCVLIEQEAEYLPIIAGRIDHALNERTGAELPLFAGLEAQP